MRTTVEQVRCDFCNYGGPWTRAEDFTRHAGGVDLCRWCSDVGRNWVAMEQGDHVLTFTDGGKSWTCSCGARFHRPLLVSPTVLGAMPNIVLACAHAHLNDQPVPA